MRHPYRRRCRHVLLLDESLTVLMTICVALSVSSFPSASFRMSARLALREWHAWARQSRHFSVSMKKWNDGMPMKLCKWAFKTIRVRGWTRCVAGVCAR